MKHLSRRPRWWVLYMILVGFIALLAGESLVRVPSTGHEILLIIVVLGIYVAMMVWIFANAEALQDEKALHPDANTRGRQMPVTERQATYRLAMIRHSAQLQTRNGRNDKTT